MELPFLKITYLYINIRKISAQRRILLAKAYEQQTAKHLPNSKSSWNQYIWVHIWKKEQSIYQSNNYHFSYLSLATYLFKKY